MRLNLRDDYLFTNMLFNSLKDTPPFLWARTASLPIEFLASINVPVARQAIAIQIIALINLIGPDMYSPFLLEK